MRTRLSAAALAALTTLLLATGSASAAVPKRIVALTPFTANALAALNVKVYARGDMPGSNDAYLPSVKNIRKLALSHPNGPNMELIASYNPDLVLSSPEWNAGNKTMKQLGMTVKLSEPTKVSDVPTQTKYIGGLVGKAAQAKKKAAEQASAISTIRGKARSHPSVLLILGVGKTPYAFLRNSWGGDVVTQAGGRLITGGLANSGGFARISNEFVIEKKPDVIIAVPHGTTTAADRRKLADELKTNVAWQETPAFRSGKLFVADNNDLLQATPLVRTVMEKIQTQYLKNN